ncbi:MAG: COX15/CtaA family protein [Pseudomonadota bacterium]
MLMRAQSSIPSQVALQVPGMALARPMGDAGAFWIRAWLMVLALMVYAMILIGGATRLTDSGLSITEWAPITGALPPLSEAAWLSELEKYRETAEYQYQNRGMSMAEFQYIYWWEWGHRLFGRLIGLVALAGFAVFAFRRWLGQGWGWRLAALITLGGLQGFVGWWMVASGIGETTRIDVAPYRLMTHFTLALVIIGVIAWFWMDLGRRARDAVPDIARWSAVVLAIGIFLQMASGALVAGLDAGRSYTDWPLMAGEAFPRYYIDPALGARSLFEGREATQFNHRTGAYLLWAGALGAAWFFRKTAAGRPFVWVAGLVTMQAIWGILTLVNAAPLDLALVHQGLGVLVFLAGVRLAWRVSYSAEAAGTPMRSTPSGATRGVVSTNTA